MIEIARMLPQEEPFVRILHRVCMPSQFPERPKYWYEMNPTSVAVDPDTGTIVGARSISMDMSGGLMYLQGLFVDPRMRGLGIADDLFRWEIDRGLEVGVRSFLSATWPGNTPMQKLFERHGFHHCNTVPGYFHYFTPATEGLIYAWHKGVSK